MEFSTSGAYQDKGSNATIEFFPGASGNRFTWQGANQSKNGTYELLRDHLELYYNYTREETYKVTILSVEQGDITGFRLTDRHGRETEFRKV